jgi:hypothetical protein
VAFLISKAIQRRYRGGHPRCYLAIGSQAQKQSSSQWLTTFTSSATNAYAAFITATANGAMWSGVGAEVCVHTKLNHEVVTAPFVDIVQAYVGQQQMASQRRRIGR